MPHAGDDLASADEVKVYKDEGDEEEQRSSENLSEDKIGLVTETEEVKSERGDDATSTASAAGSNHSFLDLPSPFGAYPWISPYSYHNAAAAAAAMAGLGRLPPAHPAGLGFYLYGGGSPSAAGPSLGPTNHSVDRLSQPPPAHMGIPPLHLDHKNGLPRPPLYPLPPPPSSPLLYPFYSPADFSKCWSSLAAGYPYPSAAFPAPYPSLTGSPFGPTAGLFAPPPPPPPAAPPCSPGGRSRQPSIGLTSTPPGPRHSDFFHMSGLLDSPRQRLMMSHHRRPEYGSTGVPSPPEPPSSHQRTTPRRPLVKKPLNAFMLFMKEMRQKVIDECTLKESAAINQILGRKWHALDKAEQAKYYEMARKEKELHMQLYPGWSARDNYGMHSKKKRKLRDGQDLKKCHPRFSLDHQPSSWGPLSRSDSDSERCSSVNGADTSLLTAADL